MAEELSVECSWGCAAVTRYCSDVHRMDVFSSCCSDFVFAVTLLFTYKMLNLPPTQLGSACAPSFCAVLCSHGVSHKYWAWGGDQSQSMEVTELEGASSWLTCCVEQGSSSRLFCLYLVGPALPCLPAGGGRLV